jgi:hypothetical protein
VLGIPAAGAHHTRQGGAGASAVTCHSSQTDLDFYLAN